MDKLERLASYMKADRSAINDGLYEVCQLLIIAEAALRNAGTYTYRVGGTLVTNKNSDLGKALDKIEQFRKSK